MKPLQFHYTGRNNEGKKIKGVVKAEDFDAAITLLQKKNITPINIEARKHYFDFSSLIKKLSTFNTVDAQELMRFCRGLAALNEAGVPLVKAIKQLASTCSSNSLAAALTETADDIASGKTLANSLRNHPQIFSPIFTNIIEIGENTGDLSKAFLQLASYTEMNQTNRRRLLSTLRYPFTVIVIAIAAAIIVNVIVIPKFTPIFARFHSKLPLATRIVVAIANCLAHHWLGCLLTFIAIVFTIPCLLLHPRVKIFWDKLKLHLPIIGNLQQRIILFQFTWTFSLILRSGMPLIKGLILAANATGNSYFNQQICLMGKNIEKGESLSTAAITSQIFPQTVLQMISVGEESGKLEHILDAVTTYYEREVEYDIKRLNDLLEPILLIIIGGMVLVLALGVYLPIWNLVDLAKIS